MKPQYQSAFSYNITRPYPYRWFTWVTIIGGVIAAVLFSLVNFAANGYYLQTYYTSDPNGTEATSWWFDKAPISWFSKLSTSCQPQQLTVGNAYFTTNLGMSYTVQQIAQMDNTGNVTHLLPSVPYMNTTLLSCEVGSMEVQVRGNGFPNVSNWQSWTDTQASATTSCIITGTGYRVNVTLLTKLPAVSEGLERPCLQLNNEQTQPSLWYGCKQLELYYGGLGGAMIYDHIDPTDENPYPTWFRGYIPLSRNGTSDIGSMDFFSCKGWFFVQNSGAITFNPEYIWMPQTLGDWNRTQASPRIASPVDKFAKLFYSTLLTDLGQPNESNALASAELLRSIHVDDSVPALQVKPATFFMEYACSMPVRKDAGSLIITILIADIVFLQAVWQLFTWVTVRVMHRKHPESNQCETCDRKKNSVSYEPLRDAGEPFGTASRTPASSTETSLLEKGVSSRRPFSIARRPLSGSLERSVTPDGL